MVGYTKVNVKLPDSQIKKLKDAVKDNTGTTLGISLKMFNGNNLPQNYYSQKDKKKKVRNAFNNNMSTDLKLSKAQINKIIQYGGFLSKLLGPLLLQQYQQQMQEYKKNIRIWKYNFNNFKVRNE